MAELRIGSIGDDRHLEQVLRLAAIEPRKIGAEPGRELGRGEHAAHQIGLHQRRRQEVGPVRLELRGIVHVVAEVVEAPLDQQILQRLVAGGVRVVERERKAERGVRMHAGPDRVGLLRQEIQVALDERIGQRLQVLLPALRLRRRAAVEFLGELENPRPPVRPLERLRARTFEVRRFDLDVLAR